MTQVFEAISVAVHAIRWAEMLHLILAPVVPLKRVIRCSPLSWLRVSGYAYEKAVMCY